MIVDDRTTEDPTPEASFDALLTYTELLNAPRLAQLYSFLLREGPVDVETVTRELDLPHSTAYKYVGTLEELGVLTRHDTTPTTLTVAPIHLEFETEQGPVQAPPALVDAIGRQRENEDIRVFVDRQGVAKLAAALHYTTRIEAGDLTERTAANKLGVHPVEGLTVFSALRDVLEDAASYDPSLEVDA